MPYSRAMASSTPNVHNTHQGDGCTRTAVSIDEYLHTVYRPDCDYIDGEVVERNVGEFDHATVQGVLLRRLFEFARKLHIRVLPELRMRVSSTRFRIPDICVMLKISARY